MPLLFEQEKKGEGRLAVWHINETENELLQLLPMEPDLAGQLQGIGHPEKRREWLASRILLHQLTGNTQALIYQPGGQPCLQQKQPRISLSHTHNYAAAVASEHCQPGVDIEYQGERAGRLLKRFANEEELSQLKKLKQQSAATLLWCAKETVYKVLNRPGLLFREEIRVNGFSRASQGRLLAEISAKPACRLDLHYLSHPAFQLVWHW
ncbi:MAG TPA: 4'-phosphopantetheinyl transferase superfamily protein [Bacteroidales bacterium]|nr:4'-phosphopantetheinyl transferase superfamily protein [Bacteroidales bacterium]